MLGQIHYTIWEWILFFYIYGFIGWIWESGYASIKNKRFVNRGFLHGPIIPIYGFGALGILLCTMDVRENTVLVFIFGMAGATALEYATGRIMEKIFHVKYWDYSEFKYNLDGYICLPASIAWGFFSVLLVQVINVPVQNFVFQIRSAFTEIMALILTAGTAVDIHSSVGEALSLKEMLEKLNESKDYIKKMQKRMEVVSAVKLDDYRRLKEKHAQELRSGKARLEANLESLREMKKKQLGELLLKAYEMKNAASAEKNIQQYIDGIYSQIREMGARRDKDYRRIVGHLKRNPNAVSKEYAEELKNIKGLTE